MNLRTYFSSALAVVGFALVSANDYQSLYDEYVHLYKDTYLASLYSLDSFTTNLKLIDYHNS
jgi:hypothetical protein